MKYLSFEETAIILSVFVYLIFTGLYYLAGRREYISLEEKELRKDRNSIAALGMIVYFVPCILISLGNLLISAIDNAGDIREHCLLIALLAVVVQIITCFSIEKYLRKKFRK